MQSVEMIRKVTLTGLFIGRVERVFNYDRKCYAIKMDCFFFS